MQKQHPEWPSVAFLSSLDNLSAALRAARDPQHARALVCRFAPAFRFPATSGALYLHDGVRDLLAHAYVWGMLGLSTETFDPKDCWAFRLGRDYRVNDQGLHHMPCRHWAPVPPARSLCVPLHASGSFLGTLNVVQHSLPLNPPYLRPAGIPGGRAAGAMPSPNPPQCREAPVPPP